MHKIKSQTESSFAVQWLVNMYCENILESELPVCTFFIWKHHVKITDSLGKTLAVCPWVEKQVYIRGSSI
jgi:hypothetical protein